MGQLESNVFERDGEPSREENFVSTFGAMDTGGVAVRQVVANPKQSRLFDVFPNDHLGAGNTFKAANGENLAYED